MNGAEALRVGDHDSGRSSPSTQGAIGFATPPRRKQDSLSVSPPTLLGGRSLDSCVGIGISSPEESPALPKRRKMFHHHDDTPSSVSSPRDSPVNLTAFSDFLSLSMDELSSQSFDDSNVSSPTASPATFRRQHDFRKRYKKDELWRAIASDYEYLMDKGIIETCKSTESDLSWESDDLASDTRVSFTEFMQQYSELTDWLNHIHLVTQRQSCSLSEKYLNQTYHEEMLRSSPRRKLFNGYAKQLARRYPNMKEEINARLHYLNSQWEGLLRAISPSHGYQDEQTMLRDLEQDLSGLKKWLHEVESRLLPLYVRPEWSKLELQEKLCEHQALQKDIESHSKIFSAVLKLCDRLQSLGEEGKSLDKVTSETLEHRWHTVLLQSLEWQCRLEEAIAGGKVRVRKFPSEEDVSEDWSDVSSSKADDSYVDVLGRVQRKLGDFDDCLDSDQSNFDTIPFSENEYEKIQVDSDAQTEPLAERVSPELADVTGRKAERCDSSDQGIDSALGRSLSDRSLDTDSKQGAASVTHATFKLTSDQVNKVVKKVISGEAVEMRATGGTTGGPLAGQPLKLRAESRCESHDVGYGSESHSNDEPDGSVSARPADAKSNALQAVCESQGVSQEDLDAVVRRRNKSPEDMEVNEEMEEDGIAPPFPDPTWRHSMTSAYDTSSNCSDGAACQNDFETSLDTTVETEVHVTTETSDAGLSSSVEVNSDMVIDAHKKVKHLMKSPSQDFYRMTMIETDSEPTSSASKMNPNEECRSGATTDAESELSKSLELPFDDVPVIAEEAIPVVRASGVTNINSELDFPVTNGAFDSNQLRKSDSSLSDTRSETARSLEEVAAKLAVCDNQEYYNNNRLTASKEELDTPKNNGLLMGSYEITDTDGLLATPNVTNDVVQSLFHQAEAMIREGELPCYQPQRFPEEELKRNKRKSKRKLEKAGGSLPESDASGFRHEDSSSCDASSEGARSTCDSDSDASDLSSSFSEEDNHHHSAILANGCQSTSSTGDATLCGSRSLSCSPHKEGLIPFRRKSASKTHHGDRPRSITALYELTSGLDLSQFTTSISEGAIDNLKRLRELKQASEVGHKLRRTSSDTLKPYETTPHKHRRRRSKRAGSDDSGKLCSSPKPLHSTPLPLRSRTSDPHWSASQSTQDEEPRERKPHSRRSLEREVARRDASGSEPAALLPLPVRCVDSDTDHQPSSMNSTMDPADQEQAWDPFQLAPYSSVSDDPTEEKQDASHLQGEWEHGLEFEDDFQLGSFGQRPDRSKLASRTSPHGSFLEASTRTLDDSDSDLEDFEHCIEESKKAIHFTENTLKNAKDPMGTRIFLDPSEYNDPLATCHTNIKCLQVIIETLESEKGLTTVTDEHIQNVYDLIEQWRDLEGLARERKEQSQALTDMYEDIVKVNKSLLGVEDDLANDSFNDISDLVKMINVLQKKHMALGQSQGPQLLKLSSQVGTFSRKNPEVNMQKFAEQVSLLQQNHTDVVDRSRARLADLQPQLLSWYDYSETQRESAYLLQCQEEQLRCVDLAQGVVDFSDDDLRDTIEDLRANKQDFDLLEAKFRSLQSLAGELSDVTSSQAQSEMKARTLQLDMDLDARRRHRQDILDAMEKKLESRRQDEAAAVSEEDAAAAEAAAAARRKLGSDEAEPQTKAGKDEVDSCSAKKPSRFIRFMRWLRRSMPMQAVLVLMFAVLYILHPNSGDSLASYCIRLTPELRHLQGPPPM